MYVTLQKSATQEVKRERRKTGRNLEPIYCFPPYGGGSVQTAANSKLDRPSNRKEPSDAGTSLLLIRSGCWPFFGSSIAMVAPWSVVPNFLDCFSSLSS